MIVVPYMIRLQAVCGLKNAVRVAVTGYARVLGRQQIPYRADLGLPDLGPCRLRGPGRLPARRGPERVYLTHGPASFRDHLRDLGYRAFTVEERVAP
ncbi:MAG: hypothetical protein U1E76_08225 [Planctomycetota bacterium]